MILFPLSPAFGGIFNILRRGRSRGRGFCEAFGIASRTKTPGFNPGDL